MPGSRRLPRTSPTCMPRGVDVLVVSSGAIALGRTVLGLPPGALSSRRARRPPPSGRSRWRALGRGARPPRHRRRPDPGDAGDTEERRRYLNARATIEAAGAARRSGRQRERHGGDHRDPLRRQRPAGGARRHDDGRRRAGAVLRYRRALHRAAASRPERPPPAGGRSASRPRSRRWPAGPASELSRGGMRTKIEAAKIAVGGRRPTWSSPTAAGRTRCAASSRGRRAARGSCRGSDPRPPARPGSPGRWSRAAPCVIDAGAAQALAAGKSLLPAGVCGVEGSFDRGDAVLIRDRAGADARPRPRRLRSAEAAQILGRPSAQIAELLGYAGRA